MFFKPIMSFLALALTFYAFYPYYRSILKNETIPHYFSWIIWGIATTVVFLGQYADGGGIGTWSIGLSGLLTLGVAILAFQKRSHVQINKWDWVFLVVALASIPLWYFTKDPLAAVILLTFIDLVAFVPTFRKLWKAPFSEKISFYHYFGFRNFLVLLALENYSITTVLFPLLIGIACYLLVVMIYFRRLKRAE